MKDLFGKAILDYQTNNAPEDLITETTISEEDEEHQKLCKCVNIS